MKGMNFAPPTFTDLIPGIGVVMGRFAMDKGYTESNRGILAEVLDMGVKEGFVDKSGAWYAYNGDKIGQGKANACKFLEENMDIANEIEAKVRDKLMPKPEPKKDAKEEPAEANGELL